MADAASEADRAETAFHHARLARFSRDQHSIAARFLSDYQESLCGMGMSVAQGFTLWSAKHLENGTALVPAERGLLMYAITHTREGKRRLLLARDGKPDKFLCVPDPGDRLDCVDLSRLAEGGDLARREDERDGTAYIERLARGLGFMPEQAEEREMWLPYKDADDEPPEPGWDG